MIKNLLPPKPVETQSAISDDLLVQEKPLDSSLHSACSALPDVVGEWESAPFRLHRPVHIAVAITAETTDDAITELEWMIERLRGGEMNAKGRGAAKAAFFAWSFRHEPNP